MMPGLQTRRRVLPAMVAVSIAALTPAAGGQQPQPPVQEFRVQSTAVTLSVSVMTGNRPVPGLVASDFSVTDNGVPQQISRVDFEQVPIDVTLVLDTSFSTVTTLEQIRRDAERILSVLRPVDRARVLVFQSAVYELLPLQSVNGEKRFAPPAPFLGFSSVRDAIIAALISQPEPGRRRLTVAITDGDDTKSINESTTLYDVARASDAVLHILRVSPPRMPAGATLEVVRPDGRANDVALRRPWPSFLRGEPAMTKEDWNTFENLPELTGGAFHGPRHDSILERNVDAPRVFREVFEEFRQGYVVTYQPENVATTGWHDLAVSVKGVDAKGVRARKGYFAGSQ
jgi:hypothetical protein